MDVIFQLMHELRLAKNDILTFNVACVVHIAFGFTLATIFFMFHEPLWSFLQQIKLLWSFSPRIKNKPILRIIDSHQQPERPNTPIYNMPTEVMLLIYRHLSPASQACLALSCTKYYNHLQHVLKAPAFQYPRPFDSDWIHDPSRSELLRKVQTSSLLFCDYCLILHPRSDFDRYYQKSKLFDPRPKSCSMPGTIQPCQCLKFSPKRLNELSDKLESSNDNNTMNLMIRKHIANWHICTTSTEWGSYTLSISLSLAEDGCIHFNFNYTIQQERSNIQEDREVIICGHPTPRSGHDKTYVVNVPASRKTCLQCQSTARTPNCRSCAFLNHLKPRSCRLCYFRDSLEVTAWDDNGATTCSIKYTVKYCPPKVSHLGKQVDYTMCIIVPSCDRFRSVH